MDGSVNIGHNITALDEAAIIAEKIAENLRDEPAPCGPLTEEAAQRLADRYQAVRSGGAEIDALRKGAKEPHAALAKAVDAEFAPLADVAKAAAESLRAPLDAYVAEHGPVASASGIGRTMSPRVSYRPEVINVAAAVRHYRDHPDIAALVAKLAAADMRKAKGDDSVNIPGVQFHKEIKAV